MIEIKHGFTSLVADDPEAAAAGEVLPSHWNAGHSLNVPAGSLVGNSAATPSAAEAVSIGSGLSLIAGVLRLLGIPVFFSTTVPDHPGPFLWVQDLGGGDYTIFLETGAP